jgi:hypothetical protein
VLINWRLTLVEILVIVIRAPATTAPLWSVIVPRIRPSDDWENSHEGTGTSNTNKMAIERTDFMRSPLICE